MITVEGLVFDYPSNRALDDISFHIEEGSITALVGPNGAGKSTLLRCMAALYRPFDGRVVINGYDTVVEPRRVHHSLGYLSDFFGLYDELSVRRSLQYACCTHGVDTDRVGETIERLGLNHYIDKPAGELSRGLRQRLAIGLAIIHQPKVLLLDEPASGLDPEARIALSELFIALRDQGMTLIVSSHILAELEDYASDVLILDQGRLVDHQTVSGNGRQELIEIILSGEDDRLSTLLSGNDAISIMEIGSSAAKIGFSGDSTEQARLLASLIESGLSVCSFGPSRADLQEVYVDRMRKERQS